VSATRQFVIRRLPAAPLVEAITQRADRRRIPMEHLLPPSSAGARAFYRARQRGTVTLRAAEQLCEEFGWHPRELWGDAYDTAVWSGRHLERGPEEEGISA